MKLIALAGKHIREVKTGLTDEEKKIFPALAKHAEFALRAGIRLTFDDYLQCSYLERLAFIRAGDVVAAQAAQRTGLANSGLVGAALVTAGVDGGAAYEDLMLELVTDAAVADG